MQTKNLLKEKNKLNKLIEKAIKKGTSLQNEKILQQSQIVDEIIIKIYSKNSIS